MDLVRACKLPGVSIRDLFPVASAGWQVRRQLGLTGQLMLRVGKR